MLTSPPGLSPSLKDLLLKEIIKVMSEVEKTIQNLPGGNIDNGSKEKNSAADNTVIQQDGLPTYNSTTEITPEVGYPPLSTKSLKSKSITLDLLIRDGVMQPGEKTLSVKYLGITVTADLLPNGKIRSTDSGEIFSTPSSWAVSCKKNINPTKSSGCGWSAIRYKGKPLDTYKSKWMRENHDSARGSPISLPTAPSSGVSTPKLEPSPLLSNRLYSYGRNPSSPLVIDVKPNNPTDLLYPAMSGLPLSEYKTHIGTQVRCEGIEFSVRVLLTRSVCLRMAELSRSSKDEVSGYLAGTYNSLSNLLNVIQVFDKSEPHTRQRVLQSGLKLVGWFHSHPNKTYYPSVYDVECHMNYQLRLREQPIVACIIGKKHEDDESSLSMLCYTVSPPKLKFSERFGYISDKCGKPKLVQWKLDSSDSSQFSQEWMKGFLSNIMKEN